MGTKLSEVLHLYLNADVYCETPVGKGKLITLGMLGLFGFGMRPGFKEFSSEEVKPLLRPLSDMTEQERDHIGIELKAGIWNADDIKSWGNSSLLWTNKHLTPKVFAYLLSRSFDLFGLLESGQAIDKTKQPS